MNAGIYHDIPNADYHMDAMSISCSGLKHLGISPAHYLAYVAEPPKETPALVFGRQVHMAVLEPDKWAERHAVAPKIDRRTKAGKLAWESFLEESCGKEIISADDAETIKRMIEAVHSHPAARSLLEAPGAVEASAWWEDRETSEKCRCRPDKARDDGILVDLKTCESAAPDAFMRASWKYEYQMQAALYLDGWKAAGGKAEAFVFLAVEKAPPYAVACYMADADMVAYGRGQYLNRLVTLAECRAANHWPAYSEKIQPLGLPAWAFKEDAA